MSNRFDKQRGGFLDMAVSVRKRAKTFLDDVDRVIDWRPIERFLKKKLRRNKDAIGNPAYPPLSMFKVLLLQRWYSLSDQAMDDNLSDRISFCRFTGFSMDCDTPDSTTICRFRNHLVKQKPSIVEPIHSSYGGKFHGPRLLITSVLYRPITDSAMTLS